MGNLSGERLTPNQNVVRQKEIVTGTVSWPGYSVPWEKEQRKNMKKLRGGRPRRGGGGRGG